MTEPFYMLYKKIARRKDLTARDKVLLAVIQDRIGRNEDCWPGVRTISKDTGLSRPTVIESLKRLEEKGLLEISRPGRGKVNHYNLVAKSGQETLPLRKGKWSRTFTTGGQEPLPEAVKKLDQNEKEPLKENQYRKYGKKAKPNRRNLAAVPKSDYGIEVKT